ncbi:type II toxin-antitoxin system VapC family toxin [Polymorphobacter fuscus]|uniref:type II toxin-antitoxin system VapC family toxin n=1 Tax=Sandarakinorhabdus fusca TaxID=1439888 RepID=UPI00129498E5|nr:type II toxin-antitoxin system VapC family toxin [Polymorphobacter fuscus]NJC09639.1 hypothetical protein [Polymorphobacter fuscus]
MTLYLDASAIVPLFVAEAGTDPVLKVLTDHPDLPLVGDFALGEVASALGRLARIGLISFERASAALAMADNWRLVGTETPAFDPVDIRVAASLVRRFELKLRLPDAIHAATCQRLDATLVTFDRRLADAASALGLAVIVPA